MKLFTETQVGLGNKLFLTTSVFRVQFMVSMWDPPDQSKGYLQYVGPCSTAASVY